MSSASPFPTFLIVLGLLVGIFCDRASAADAEPGKQVAQSLKVKDAGGEEHEIRYWLFLPKDYGNSDKTKKWPMMLFLHGAGERGEDLAKVKVHGPPKIVETKPEFEFVTVSPQCAEKSRWEAEMLIKLVDHIQKTQQIDDKRTYVTGLSMGGFGTWSLAAKYPDRFAAAVPICGGGNVDSAEKLKTLPIWVFHGAKDTAVKLEQSEKMVDAIKKAGGEPKFTIYPEAGHDSWTESYNNAELYKWLLEQKRS